MRKKFFIFLLASTASFLLISCDSKQKSSPEAIDSIPVTVTTPVIKDISVYLDSIGSLHPSILMEIRPQVDGTILKVLASEGQWVKQGSPLFQIDPKQYEIKVKEAEAQVSIDRASLEVIQKKLNRYKDLAQKDLIAQSEWDELEADAEKAKATIDLHEASLHSAKVDLDYCTLTSPIEGRVGRIDVHPGFIVSKGQSTPLTIISKMDPLLVEFAVTEKEFPKIPKDALEIEIQSLCSQNICHNATVTFLDNHFDPKTGLLLIRGKVQNQDYSLRPGQSVHVRIPIAKTPNAKLIPQKAIKYNQEGPYVYVIQDDMTVAVRQLILGNEQGTDQIILEGLDPSERIVLDGHLRLSSGSKVEIKQ